MSKYEEFELKFKTSGLTQKAYAEKHDMSSCMVSYYLRRARSEKKNSKEEKVFTPLKVTGSFTSIIEILTPEGIQIRIPIGV